jgi:hypothetical protein
VGYSTKLCENRAGKVLDHDQVVVFVQSLYVIK